MPKFNPKRKAKSQQPKSPSPSDTPKKSGTYSRGSPRSTKLYGIIIIAAIASGMVLLLSDYMQNLPPTIAQWDHVQLRLQIWIWPADGKWNDTITPDQDTTQWYNFTTIYAPSSDSNVTITQKVGLPLGIYNKVRSYSVGRQSPPFQILNCIDINEDQKDDKTGQSADGWGFPESHPFYNKTIVVKFEVLAHDPNV